MTLAAQIKQAILTALDDLFPGTDFSNNTLTINLTKPEFKGDYTVVLFPFLKTLKTTPAALGLKLIEYLSMNTELFSHYEVVGGFLNLTIKDSIYSDFLFQRFNDPAFGEQDHTGVRIMVEYSSPNTNKPLHFGHLRNNFLGAAVAEILKATGNSVVKATLINDRGIHICKSMIAWKRFANGATPETANMKGDHFVGHYYVKFNQLYKEEVTNLTDAGIDAKIAEKDAPAMLEAQEMLRLWEAGDPEVYQLWQTMNGWVYEGFDVTYKRMGVAFDKKYYESDTYLLGKQLVEEGLQKGALFQKDNGSVWIDMTNDGLDEKLLLRGDGTSVYITQDLGTAKLKYDEFQLDQSIYVIGDEQNYHMQVLKLILQKLGEPCADSVYHLSYGMVELPTGRLKSREGTAVDADDMMDEMLRLSREQTEESGKTEGFSPEELTELYETIGLGALKFYLLRVDPKKKMIFDPKESIDLHGFTATFIQYVHARICSILRKENLPLMPEKFHFDPFILTAEILPLEKKLLVQLEQYPAILEAAATELNPSELCNYSFQLAQNFNTFYAEHSISKAENAEKKQLRLMLIVMTASVLRHAMHLLGVRMPEKM